MTYKTEKSLVDAGSTAVGALAFLGVPLIASTSGLGFAGTAVLGAFGFAAIFAIRNLVAGLVDSALHRRRFRRPETRILLDFTERVGVSFTLPDLIDAFREVLELRADMGAVLLRANTWEPIYQSPTAMCQDVGTLGTLERNFREWSEGFCFIGDGLSLVSSNLGARGFFVNAKGFAFFVFTRLCPLVELEAFRSLYGELRIYFDRVITISGLFEVASLSKEWELVAETQRSFLPKTLPTPDRLELAMAYRPLINVSGDYYDAIAVDPARTLLVIGDVSGKGLAAGLIMGIIIHTIRVAKDKTDLAGLVRAVDLSVRDMGFDDKYTVLFLGLVDTGRRTLRYINAAMADPLIISQTAHGPRIKRLEPTAGLVGLVPLDAELRVEEIPISTDELILLASDGVTEVDDAAGRRLGETELFDRALLMASRQSAADFVGTLTGLLYEFVGDRPLKDDVTILAAKVGRLWD